MSACLTTPNGSSLKRSESKHSSLAQSLAWHKKRFAPFCETAIYWASFWYRVQHFAMRTETRLDPLSPQERSERMSRVRSRNTTPELIVRRITWQLGFRYRLHSRKLPGHPDLVFAKRRKVIFVHGCFWHQHKRCHHYKMPQSRLEFWLPKLAANTKRDLANQKALRRQGWDYLVIWECQLSDEQKVCQEISRFLS